MRIINVAQVAVVVPAVALLGMLAGCNSGTPAQSGSSPTTDLTPQSTDSVLLTGAERAASAQRS